MQIRDALESDLPAIVDIYNAAIPHRTSTADLYPLSVESRLSWYQEHSPTFRPIWVIESEQIITGWLSFQSFYNGRPAYNATADLSIYIAPSYHRQGLANQLLQRAIDHSPELGINTLLGFIFSHNLASLSLFKKFGFSSWGYLPKIANMDGTQRDLVIMGKKVNS